MVTQGVSLTRAAEMEIWWVTNLTTMTPFLKQVKLKILFDYFNTKKYKKRSIKIQIWMKKWWCAFKKFNVENNANLYKLGAVKYK